MSKRKPNLGQTLMDVKSPLAAAAGKRPALPKTGSPPPPPPPVIDPGALLEAWERHTEVLKGVLDAIERNEKDNAVTRALVTRSSRLAYTALVGMMMVGYLVWSSATKSAVAVEALQKQATFALTELANTQQELEKTQLAMRTVSEAMVKSNDAHLPHPVEEHSHRRGASRPSPNVEAIKARVVAQEASLRAQVQLLDGEDDAPKKARVQKRLAAVKKRGRDLKIDSF